MKYSSPLTLTTTVMIILLVIAATFTQASPADRMKGGEIDENLVRRVARRLIEQMTDFQRIRRTGLSARHGALSDYMKMRALSANINNPYGPGRRK